MRSYSLLFIKSQNSLFNADFDNDVRRLPNGKIFSTDKKPKYCAKYYLDKKGFNILGLARENEDGTALILEQSVYSMLKRLDIKLDETDFIWKMIDKCLDLKYFGATISVSKFPVHYKGIMQIGYGMNISGNENSYKIDILSPFASDVGKKQTTLGAQYRVEDVLYLFDIITDTKDINKKLNIDLAEIDLMKESLRKGVNFYKSNSTTGTETALFVDIIMKDEFAIISSPKDLIFYDKDNSTVSLKGLEKLNEIADIVIYTDDNAIKIKDIPVNASIKPLF